MTTSDLVEWLAGQLAKSRRELQARERSAATWSGGTAADWRASSRVAGKKVPTKKERLQSAARERRIAEKCRHDVAAIEELTAIVTARDS